LDALGHPRPWSAVEFLHFRIFYFRLPDLGKGRIPMDFRGPRGGLGAPAGSFTAPGTRAGWVGARPVATAPIFGPRVLVLDFCFYLYFRK
jgi:hypothetical protein